MIKRAEWLAIAKDRTAVLMFVTLFVIVVILIITAFVKIQPSDIQLPLRYTGYGPNNIYRDQWYNQFAYIGFGLFIIVVNGFLVVRTYMVDRALALGILAMTIFIMIFALFVLNAVFGLTPV